MSIYNFNYTLISIKMEHKTIKLWISTRLAGNILSGNEKLNVKIIAKIKEMSGIKITQNDIDIFPKILKLFPLYQNTIYRGVFNSDELYNEIVKNNNAITTRYYSFSKSFDVAKQFGNKIILLIDSCNNFDISKYSRESEIILDRYTKLFLRDIEKKGEYILINLYVV